MEIPDSCAVLSIDMKHSARKLGFDIDYKFLEAGLHNNPKLLREKLIQIVRKKATSAGTSCRKVTLETRDQIPTTALGDPIFMGRTLYASLTGRPDLVLKNII